MVIPLITIRKNKISEADELGKYESGPLWIQDNDVKRGRELNFRIYDELSGLYEIYLDAELKYEDDVADSITAGATMVTISESIDGDKMKRMLFYTDSLIFYLRRDSRLCDFFINNGGMYVYSDSLLINNATIQFTRELDCKNCNLIKPIGEFNGGRNKEAPALP